MCKCEKKCNCCLYSHCVCSGYGMLEERSSFSVSLFWSCSSRDVCLTSVFWKVHGQDVRSLLQYFGPWYVVFSCRSVGRGALMMRYCCHRLYSSHTKWWCCQDTQLMGADALNFLSWRRKYSLCLDFFSVCWVFTVHVRSSVRCIPRYVKLDLNDLT